MMTKQRTIFDVDDRNSQRAIEEDNTAAKRLSSTDIIRRLQYPIFHDSVYHNIYIHDLIILVFKFFCQMTTREEFYATFRDRPDDF